MAGEIQDLVSYALGLSLLEHSLLEFLVTKDRTWNQKLAGIGKFVSSLGSCECGLKREKPLPCPGAPVGDWPLYPIICNNTGKRVQSQTQTPSH